LIAAGQDRVRPIGIISGLMVQLPLVLLVRAVYFDTLGMPEALKGP